MISGCSVVWNLGTAIFFYFHSQRFFAYMLTHSSHHLKTKIRNKMASSHLQEIASVLKVRVERFLKLIFCGDFVVVETGQINEWLIGNLR